MRFHPRDLIFEPIDGGIAAFCDGDQVGFYTTKTAPDGAIKVYAGSLEQPGSEIGSFSGPNPRMLATQRLIDYWRAVSFLSAIASGEAEEQTL